MWLPLLLQLCLSLGDLSKPAPVSITNSVAQVDTQEINAVELPLTARPAATTPRTGITTKSGGTTRSTATTTIRPAATTRAAATTRPVTTTTRPAATTRPATAKFVATTSRPVATTKKPGTTAHPATKGPSQIPAKKTTPMPVVRKGTQAPSIVNPSPLYNYLLNSAPDNSFLNLKPSSTTSTAFPIQAIQPPQYASSQQTSLAFQPSPQNYQTAQSPSPLPSLQSLSPLSPGSTTKIQQQLQQIQQLQQQLQQLQKLQVQQQFLLNMQSPSPSPQNAQPLQPPQPPQPQSPPVTSFPSEPQEPVVVSRNCMFGVIVDIWAQVLASYYEVGYAQCQLGCAMYPRCTNSLFLNNQCIQLDLYLQQDPNAPGCAMAQSLPGSSSSAESDYLDLYPTDPDSAANSTIDLNFGSVPIQNDRRQGPMPGIVPNAPGLTDSSMLNLNSPITVTGASVNYDRTGASRIQPSTPQQPAINPGPNVFPAGSQGLGTGQPGQQGPGQQGPGQPGPGQQGPGQPGPGQQGPGQPGPSGPLPQPSSLPPLPWPQPSGFPVVQSTDPKNQPRAVILIPDHPVAPSVNPSPAVIPSATPATTSPITPSTASSTIFLGTINPSATTTPTSDPSAILTSSGTSDATTSTSGTSFPMAPSAPKPFAKTSSATTQDPSGMTSSSGTSQGGASATTSGSLDQFTVASGAQDPAASASTSSDSPASASATDYSNPPPFFAPFARSFRTFVPVANPSSLSDQAGSNSGSGSDSDSNPDSDQGTPAIAITQTTLATSAPVFTADGGQEANQNDITLKPPQVTTLAPKQGGEPPEPNDPEVNDPRGGIVPGGTPHDFFIPVSTSPRPTDSFPHITLRDRTPPTEVPLMINETPTIQTAAVKTPLIVPTESSKSATALIVTGIVPVVGAFLLAGAVVSAVRWKIQKERAKKLQSEMMPEVTLSVSTSDLQSAGGGLYSPPPHSQSNSRLDWLKPREITRGKHSSDGVDLNPSEVTLGTNPNINEPHRASIITSEQRRSMSISVPVPETPSTSRLPSAGYSREISLYQAVDRPYVPGFKSSPSKRREHSIMHSVSGYDNKHSVSGFDNKIVLYTGVGRVYNGSLDDCSHRREESESMRPRREDSTSIYRRDERDLRPRREDSTSAYIREERDLRPRREESVSQRSSELHRDGSVIRDELK